LAQDKLGRQLEAYESTVGRRIGAALALLEVPQVAKRLTDTHARRVEAERLLPVLSLLDLKCGQILELRNSNAALHMLAQQIEANRQNKDLFQAIGKLMQSGARQIRALSELLANYRYPLDHAKGNISIAQYAVENIPQSDDLSAILGAGGEMLDNLTALCVRICGRLAATAEAVETVLGLPPLPEPKTETEPKP
jgi:hypothetical protein